jgi:dihydrodipicolinate synthase/N-acetylneuraminate lyase
MAQFLQSVHEDIPTFVGIKFSSPSLDEAVQAFHTNDNKFAVFLENDQVFFIIYFFLNIIN